MSTATPSLEGQQIMRKSAPILLLLLVLIAWFTTGLPISAETTLSSDGLNPTAFTLTSGTNNINGTVSLYPDVSYFSIDIAANHQLTAINLVSHANGDFISWFAAMSGAQFTENSTISSNINISNLLGQAHVGPGQQPLPYNVANSMGLNMPLTSGTYSFRMQNWGRGIAFGFEFEVEEAPPNSINLFAISAENPSAVTTMTAILIGLVIMTIASINMSIHNTRSAK